MREETPAKPLRPYKRWDYFEKSDHAIFFGRELETRLLVSEILSSRLILLYAKSGTGKTSLINAGVRPLLEYHPLQTFVVRMGDDPAEAIKGGTRSLNPDRYDKARRLRLAPYLKEMLEGYGKSLVLFLDQFEEFFIRLTGDVQVDFVEQVAEVYHDTSLPVFLVFSLREDFFVEMDCFKTRIPTIFENNSNLRLHWFDRKAAREAIEEPAKIFGTSFEPALVETLLEDLQRDGKGIEPIRLQLVCDALWDATGRGEKKVIGLADYQGLGEVGVVEEKAFADALRVASAADETELLPSLLRMLITEAGTKNYVEFGTILERLKVEPRVLERVLDSLRDARLLRASRKDSTTFYELSHDYLVLQVQRWLSRFGGHPDFIQEKVAELAKEWAEKRSPIKLDDFILIDGQRALVEPDATADEMLTQAAVKYGRNIKFWLDRLGSEEKALSLLRGLTKEAQKSNLASALGLLRSAAATQELVKLAVAASYFFSVDKSILKELKARPDSSALDELYQVSREPGRKDPQKSATAYLAALRREGVRLPDHWSKSRIYAVLAWMSEYGSLREGIVFKTPPLLGRVLERFEETRAWEAAFTRAASWGKLSLVALAVGLYRGFLFSLIGMLVGPMLGVLFAAFANLWEAAYSFISTGVFGWAAHAPNYPTYALWGLKFGFSLSLAGGMTYFAAQVFYRGIRAMKILKTGAADDEESRSA